MNTEAALKVVNQWLLGFKPVIQPAEWNAIAYFKFEQWYNRLEPKKANLVTIALECRYKALQREGSHMGNLYYRALGELLTVLYVRAGSKCPPKRSDL